MKKVLLVCMPFYSLKTPSLGISALKAKLSEMDIKCDVQYFCISFAEMFSLSLYENLCSNSAIFVGDRIFAEYLFPDRLPSRSEYLKTLKRMYNLNPIEALRFFKLSEMIPDFISQCISSTSWDQYDIIGFSSTFEQQCASLLLAKIIKKQLQDKVIVFGGGNCENEMGVGIIESSPYVDFVCSGEAENSFPMLVNNLRSGKSTEEIDGVIFRKDGKPAFKSLINIVNDLNCLPIPDYSDYFQQIEMSNINVSICKELHMETSRGCWWGAKSQCSFCGINKESICFRSKSPDKVIEEIEVMSRDYLKPYSIKSLFMADNVLDNKYYSTLLPRLHDLKINIPIFYEVKANLQESDVKALKSAGITDVQAGIESLSTPVLKKMNKGITAIQNIQALKLCKQYGVMVRWNLLYDIPGESVEDYINLYNTIQIISHLIPPQDAVKLILQRFSPYFNNPDQFGIFNVQANPVYFTIYPFSEDILKKIAYFFTFEYDRNENVLPYKNQIDEYVNFWHQCSKHKQYCFFEEIGSNKIIIKDSRSIAIVPQIVLEDSRKDIYLYCSTIKSSSSVYEYMKSIYTMHNFSKLHIDDFLRSMVDYKLMVCENDKYLSIALNCKKT